MVVIVSSMDSQMFAKKIITAVRNSEPANIRMRQTNNFRGWMLRNSKAVICV